MTAPLRRRHAAAHPERAYSRRGDDTHIGSRKGGHLRTEPAPHTEARKAKDTEKGRIQGSGHRPLPQPALRGYPETPDSRPAPRCASVQY